ncbi:MAG: PQQ-binding-like beta-propeller repeat protein [Rhodothermales bacterium]
MACQQPVDERYIDWEVYGGDKTNSQYSALDQIHTGNVDDLKVAWIYNTKDHSSEGRSQIQFSPIIVDGVLYGASPRFKLFALNAASGEEIWSFDPYASSEEPSVFGVSRGVAYWADGEDKRLLFGVGHQLYAINATTGEPIASFGTDGFVDLRQGLDKDPTGTFWSLNTPGIVYEDLYIVGGRVAEEHPAAPGHVRAFNIRTGERAWIFHTIPHPGEAGYETWPASAWESVGGANVWTGMSVDQERGLVFLPTGSAAFDFWGGNRLGENLYANSLVALDAATGERVWHFQIVKHDIWDRDLPAAPNLLTVKHDGQNIDAVAQITKSGHVFVFNRETGEPLFPLEEFSVPPSGLEGERAWPVQVLPSKPAPFARQQLLDDDVTNISPEATAAIRDSLKKLLPATGQFIPPSTRGTIIYPGFDGGGEWGGAAHDPSSGVLYVNSNEMAWVQQMQKIDYDENQGAFSMGQQVYYFNCANCHGFAKQGAPGYPALEDIASTKNRAEVAQIVTAGGARMPGFAHLKEDEVDAVVAYLFNDAQDKEGVNATDQTIKYGHMGYNRFYDAEGYPAVKPPWGTLNAIDLNTGEFLWRVPLGEFEELTARGIPKTGTENYGGPVATAGGLIFIGGSLDEYFRAFDKDTGEEVWKSKLPAGGYATPATYIANGKQYVVIAAGGGKMGTKSGDAYVAYALP